MYSILRTGQPLSILQTLAGSPISTSLVHELEFSPTNINHAFIMYKPIIITKDAKHLVCYSLHVNMSARLVVESLSTISHHDIGPLVNLYNAAYQS